MFLFQYPGRKYILGVIFKYKDTFLYDDRACVHTFINEMDCAAAHFHPVLKCLLLGV